MSQPQPASTTQPAPREGARSGVPSPARWSVMLGFAAGVCCSAIAALGDQAGDRSAAGAASRALDRVLVSPDLSSAPVSVIALDREGVTVRDGPRSAERRVPMSQVAAILPMPEAHGPEASLGREPERMFIDTIDGQTLPGRPGPGVPDAPDAISWASSFLGGVVLPIDRVARVVLRGARPGGRGGADDIVRLANGDVVRGIATVVAGERGEQAWSVEPADAGGPSGGVPTVVPVSRVVSVVFANPTREASGAWVWLAEGTTARCESLRIDVGGQATARFAVMGSDAEPSKFDASLVRAFVPARESVRALAAMPMSQASTGRAWAPIVGDVHAAPMGLADVEFPGPGSCEFELPKGSRRIAARVELPVSSRVWGDCEVVVSCDRRELWRARLWPEAPEASFALELPRGARLLEVRVDEGKGGPIEDRVLLRSAMVALTPAP